MKKFLLILLCISIYTFSYSQSLNDIKNIKVDNLSDKQVQEIFDKYSKDGYRIDQIEEQMLQNGMPAHEWDKLKERMDKLKEADKTTVDLSRDMSQKEVAPINPNPSHSKIFGSSLFSGDNLTFEPNLRLATPENYQIGPDDELIIDVYGYSENAFKAAVSPEGILRIPNVGHVNVNGLTISQAKKLITSRLSSVYSTINTGETFVSVTLGNIRSIKVVIAGEAFKPGTYSLLSVSTVYNALVACGGPNENGSFREIKVIRNGEEIVSTIDVYDFLLTGQLKNNIRLQDQDIIKIEPYKKRIELKGELKNTGYFEAINNETLAKLIEYAGGYTTNAYKDRITVFQNTEKERKVADISNENFSSFIVNDGDIFTIDPLLDRFENKIEIAGAVFRPGIYALTTGLTLKQLIDKADGLKEDAFMTRGAIHREKENKEKEIVSFNVADVISGAETHVLKKEDMIYIASLLEMQELKKVSIFGEVKNPGDYTFHENMTLQDLIFLAGGALEKAEMSNIEISRLIKDPKVLVSETKNAEEHRATIDRDLNGLDFVLMPHDQVVLRTIAGYSNIQKVTIAGEVLYPGNYIINSKEERISDVINRAGKTTKQAYPEGAFMIRKMKTSIAEDRLEKKIADNIAKELMDEDIFEKENIVEIYLDKILKNPYSKWDLFVEDGDVISIPKEQQTVQVLGEVMLPSFVRFDKANSFKNYVQSSGGFSSNSLKRKSYVIHPNGSAMATKNFLFIRNYPDVKSGSKIYVPQKPERTNKITLGETIALSSSAVTVAALIISLLK